MPQICYELKLQKEKTKAKKTNAHNAASDLHNNFLETYFDENYDSMDAKRSKMSNECDPANLKIDEYDYCKWYKEKLDDKKTRPFTITRRWWGEILIGTIHTIIKRW